MIDLNTLFSNALTAAITNAVAPLNERIAKLELCNAESHQRLLVLEGALTDRVVALESICTTQHEAMVAMRDRIAALEDQAIVTSNAVDTRISRLENNPAQGVDTSVVAGNYAPISNEQVKAALQEWAATGGFVTRDEVEALIEQAVDNHCETYDHDSYDSAVSDLEDRDFVTNDSLEDAVREAVGNLSFDISVS